MSERTARTPELLYVEAGDLSIEDNFGFGTTIAAGSNLTINTEAQYTISNQGVVTATVLRFSLAQPPGTDGTVAPPVGSPAASPVVADISETVLINQSLDSMPDSAITMFIARTNFEPGAESGEQQHAGPLGLSIEFGTLSVTSPSGMVGQLAAGKSVVLPATAPFVARNEGDQKASALIAGVVESRDQLLSVIAPTPTAAPEATETPVPTATTEPMPTTIPSPTPEPTPTVDPTTPQGTILQVGQTWRVPGASLTISARDSTWERELHVTIAYENASDTRADFAIPDGVIRVYDDQRQTWNLETDGFLSDRVILDPGETIRYDLNFVSPAWDYSANVFIAIESFGKIESAKWGVTFDRGRLLTLPPDAVDPTTGESIGGGNQASAPSTEAETPGRAARIADMLPTEDDVPQGLVGIEEGKRERSVITSSFPDPADAERRFAEWEWKGSVYRDFAPPDGTTLPTDRTTLLDVSIHRFAGADGAAAALPYFIEARAVLLGLQSISIEPLGDQSRAVAGRYGDANEVTVYVQFRSALIRVTAFSLEGDPLADAVAVAKAILAK
jgi:hypothetical protein